MGDRTWDQITAEHEALRERATAVHNGDASPAFSDYGRFLNALAAQATRIEALEGALREITEPDIVLLSTRRCRTIARAALNPGGGE